MDLCLNRGAYLMFKKFPSHHFFGVFCACVDSHEVYHQFVNSLNPLSSPFHKYKATARDMLSPAKDYNLRLIKWAISHHLLVASEKSHPQMKMLDMDIVHFSKSKKSLLPITDKLPVLIVFPPWQETFVNQAGRSRTRPIATGSHSCYLQFLSFSSINTF